MRAITTLLALSVLLMAGCAGRFEPYEVPVITVNETGLKIPECKPYDIAEMTPAVLGCFAESSRWQMMVHPEKMVPLSDSVTAPGFTAFKE